MVDSYRRKGGFKVHLAFMRFAEMFEEPNSLIYAAITEFCDRMVKSFVVNSTRELVGIGSIWVDLFMMNKIFQRKLLETIEKCKDLKKKFEELASKGLSI